MGTVRSLRPLPTTLMRRSPGRPSIEPRLRSMSSESRRPVSRAVAMKARSRSGHGHRPGRAPAATVWRSASGASSPCNGLGVRRPTFGWATAPIGLPATRSSATRKPKNWFHVDHARAIAAAAWISANRANASRNPRGVTSGSSRSSLPTDSRSQVWMAVKSDRAARSEWGDGFAERRATSKSANNPANDSSTTRKIIQHTCPPGGHPRSRRQVASGGPPGAEFDAGKEVAIDGWLQVVRSPRILAPSSLRASARRPRFFRPVSGHTSKSRCSLVAPCNLAPIPPTRT